MKKLFVFVLTVTCTLLLAMPVLAKVSVGGSVFLDSYYHRFDADAARSYMGPGDMTPGTDDWQQLEIEVPGDTNIHAEWLNDDGNVGMYIELWLGGPNGSTDVGLCYAYGWWQITPMFKILVGHTDGSFATLEPDQALGGASGHSDADGFGNVGDAGHPQIRLEAKFNDMVTLMVSALDPREGTSFDWLTYSTLAGNEENVWPRMDVALLLNIGPVYIEPSMSWMKVKHDEGSMNIGAATFYNVYAFALGAMYTIGPFTISAEGAFGQNWYNGQISYDSLLNYPPGVVPGGVQYDREFNFEDTDDAAFWVDAAFAIGPATIHLIYGYQETDIYMFLGSQEGELEFERQMYGISVPVKMADIFIIRPEFMVYDWGEADIPDFMLQNDVPLGTEYIGGIQFLAQF
ncbi:hypothetical protein ACFL2O_11555 [Thermodesulfobacteriota bacterium]